MSKESFNKQCEEPIYINLDELETSEVLDSGSLIFRGKMEQLLEKIRQKACENEQSLKKQDSNYRRNKQKDEKRGVPSCFIIDGARGSGKSTLLRTVREALVNPQNSFYKPLYPLADIDPTELGKGENFFLYLLGRVYNILNEQYKPEFGKDDKIEEIRAALEDLRKMSGGLQVLMDSNEALKKSSDPDFFLENCVEKCANSTHLQRRFNSLLSRVANILGAQVFLVTIDDADLNFGKCEDVLEYVRKYMQTPHLIFLFAGDVRLYTHIVRGMYMRHFSKKQLRYDTTHEENRKLMVDELTDQYLQKMFPVDYRVQTDSLKTILSGARPLRIRRHRNDTQEPLFFEFLSSYLDKVMRPAKKMAVYDVLLQLPMRSAFLFLRYLSRHEATLNDVELLKYIGGGLQEEVVQDLVKYNVDYKQLERVDVAGIQHALFRFCSANRLWNSDLSMLLTEADSAKKRVALYLSGVIEQNVQRLGDKLSYWCACFPAWQSVRELFLRTHDVYQARELMDMCMKLGNGGQEKAIANLACSVMSQPIGKPLLYNRGTICLLNEDRVGNRESGREVRLGCGSLIHQFTELQEKANLQDKKFIMAFNSCLCRIDDQYTSHYYLSVYHLLMLIVEWLIRVPQELQHVAYTEKANKGENIRAVIRRKLDSVFVVPTTLRLLRGNKHASSANRRYHVFSGVNDDEFVNEMADWLEKYADVSFLSTAEEYSQSWEVFMARCEASTFSYQVNYECDSDCPRAGVILQHYMTSVETALSQFQIHGKSVLSQCIMSCPLWDILRNPPQLCMQVLNSAHIGDFINVREASEIAHYKSEFENINHNINALENRKTEIAQEEKHLKTILRTLEQEKEDKREEMRLRDEKVKSDEILAAAQHEKIDSMLQSGAELEHQIEHLEHQSDEADDERRGLLLRAQLLERVLKPGSSSMEDVRGALEREQERVNRMYSLARSEGIRNRHEENMQMLQEFSSLWFDAAHEETPKESERKVREALKNVDEKCEAISSQVESCRKESRLLKQRRTVELNRLADMRNRIEAFRKQAFEAKVAYEIAALKYQRVEAEMDEINQQLEALNSNIRQERISFESAKQAYENAKKPAEGE